MGRVYLGDAGILTPGRWRWLRALAWMVALVVSVIFTYNVVGQSAQWALVWLSGEQFATRADIPQIYKLSGAVIGMAAALMVYWAAVRWGEKRRVTELALRPLPADYLIGGAIGAGQMAAIIGIMAAAGWVIMAPSDVTAIARALKETLQSSIIEELLFRAIIFRLLWRAAGVWPALIISATLFGGGHLLNPDSTLLAALSIILGIGVEIGLYMITGRIWASIGAHAAWNFTQGWIFGATVSGFNAIAGGPLTVRPAAGVPDALSGGAFGPEASIVALLVSMLASAAVLRLAWKGGCFAPSHEPIASGQVSAKFATAS